MHRGLWLSGQGQLHTAESSSGSGCELGRHCSPFCTPFFLLLAFTWVSTRHLVTGTKCQDRQDSWILCDMAPRVLLAERAAAWSLLLP